MTIESTDGTKSRATMAIAGHMRGSKSATEEREILEVPEEEAEEISILFGKKPTATLEPKFTGSKLVSLGHLVGEHMQHGDFQVHVFDPDQYTEADRAMIPSIDNFDKYTVDHGTLYLLAFAIETGVEPVVALTGLPSVGKSLLCEYFAALTNRPFFPFTHNDQHDIGHLIGVKEVKDGETRFNPGIITRALMTPNAVLLHDEAFYIDPGTAACMQRVLQKGGNLMLPDMDDEDVTKRYLTPAEGVVNLMTDNSEGMGDVSGKFTGVQPQNTAFLDRIDVFIRMDFLNAQREQKALQKYFPDAPEILIRRCCEVARLSRVAYNSGAVSIIFSFRVLISWVRYSIKMRSIRESINLCMLNRLSEPTEVQTIEGFIDTVFGPDVK